MELQTMKAAHINDVIFLVVPESAVSGMDDLQSKRFFLAGKVGAQAAG